MVKNFINQKTQNHLVTLIYKTHPNIDNFNMVLRRVEEMFTFRVLQIIIRITLTNLSNKRKLRKDRYLEKEVSKQIKTNRSRIKFISSKKLTMMNFLIEGLKTAL